MFQDILTDPYNPECAHASWGAWKKREDKHADKGR